MHPPPQLSKNIVFYGKIFSGSLKTQSLSSQIKRVGASTHPTQKYRSQPNGNGIFPFSGSLKIQNLPNYFNLFIMYPSPIASVGRILVSDIRCATEIFV
ncbi:hypothetical protein ACKLNO_05235 [Neisseriaceae bacterium B1]